MKRVSIVALGMAIFSSVPFGHAATEAWFPTKPVRLVVPLAPGGSNDYLARLIAQKVLEHTGQVVVVDNRPGAGGNIGTDIVAKAQPDGHTLVAANVSSIAINGALYDKMPYDPVKDLLPVTLVAVFPNVLLVRAGFRAKTLQELVSLAKKDPNGITYASAGTGSSTHLAAELLNMMAGIKLRHIPYRGGGPALIALMSGEISLYFSGVLAASAHVKAGKVTALGVTSSRRWPSIPDVPTIGESGFPGYEALNWAGVLVPARTNAAAVAWWNKEISGILNDKEIAARLLTQGAQPSPISPEEFAVFIKSEIDKWSKVVRVSGARVD